MNLTGRGPGRDKGEVHSGRISQNFNRLFRSVKLARRTRSTKAHVWDVVVIIDTLEVDSPNYILEVTDNGQVTERRRVRQ